MVKLKNTTAEDILIADMGLTVTASGELLLAKADIELAEKSNELVALVGAGSIVVNNGTDDLSASEGMSLILMELPHQVRTQFERTDMVLKIACAEGAVQSDGSVTIELKMPGVMADGDAYYISGGELFFDTAIAGDKVTEIAIVDKDDVLGYGANTVVGTYHDDMIASQNSGWYVPPKYGHLYAETLGFYGKIPAELYLVIKGQRASGTTTGTMYLNIEGGRIG